MYLKTLRGTKERAQQLEYLLLLQRGPSLNVVYNQAQVQFQRSDAFLSGPQRNQAYI